MIKENAAIEIYTSRTCGFCYAAKHLLQTHGYTYTEHDVTLDDRKRKYMMELSGRRTVPQIFVDGVAIGGYQELAALIADRK
ncbi:MAG TPA: glutaredoxin domain-containing protein [Gammaproteobacteria bacterium]|nr:glutaredoxin domain-containing protein [Gammaproteobacteria bacterium]